jgi:SNF2 family DNA or RNA helicase
MRGPSVTSWQAATSAQQVAPIDVQIVAAVAQTGWGMAVRRPPKVVVTSPDVVSPRPGTVSLPLAASKIPVTGYRFDAPGFAVPEVSDSVLATGPPAARSATILSVDGLSAAARKTRIRPPDDVVRLEDRLSYLLQPPLEELLASGQLSLACQPFGYQLEGIAFLFPRQHAVLADEMGLGKTMQAIVAMRLLFHQRQLRRALVVCPKPLVANWGRELEMWAPEIPAVVIEGAQERRQWQWETQDAGVMIANYELVVRDRQEIAAVSRPFDLVILDESQRIKNRGSATNQAVRELPRRRSWALTGTPVENSADDLVGIFEFVSPGYLRTGMKPRRIGRAVSDYVLRRTKDKVLTELPPKLFRDAHIELTPDQRESYDLAEKEGVVRLENFGDRLAIQHVLELIVRLKQICNFDTVTRASAKLERLEADLEECAASGRKAIVFSQWVATLEELAERLERFHPLMFHGRVPSRRREPTIAQFRDDPRHHVLLMSYGAGSVGLNLQFASYVFLFDRWWNPAVEDQAINRAHRIGSAGPVTVTRFLTLQTIEQRIDQVLEEKRELFELIFSGTRPSRDIHLSQQEIFGLFNLDLDAGGAAKAA